MKIDKDLVDKIAHLARLEFQDEQKVKIEEDLNRILSFMESLNEVDTRVINAAFPDTVSSVNTSADITKLDNTKTDNKKAHENDSKFSNLNIQYPESLQPIERKFSVLDDDPMNHNWGGKEHTEQSVREGKYVGSEVMHY